MRLLDLARASSLQETVRRQKTEDWKTENWKTLQPVLVRGARALAQVVGG